MLKIWKTVHVLYVYFEAQSGCGLYAVINPLNKSTEYTEQNPGTVEMTAQVWKFCETKKKRCTVGPTTICS